MKQQLPISMRNIAVELRGEQSGGRSGKGEVTSTAGVHCTSVYQSRTQQQSEPRVHLNDRDNSSRMVSATIGPLVTLRRECYFANILPIVGVVSASAP